MLFQIRSTTILAIHTHYECSVIPPVLQNRSQVIYSVKPVLTTFPFHFKYLKILKYFQANGLSIAWFYTITLCLFSFWNILCNIKISIPEIFWHYYMPQRLFLLDAWWQVTKKAKTNHLHYHHVYTFIKFHT